MANLEIVLLLISGFSTLIFSLAPDAKFEIQEELPVGTLVGNVTELPNLFPELSERDRKQLQYGILNQASAPGSLFNISRTGGAIYVAKRIDREALCLALEDCTLTINILASSQFPSQFDSKLISVVFTILDINDNAPTFERDSIVLQVSERNAVDTVVKITGANDKDFLPEFKVKGYTLNSYQDVFQLTATKTLDGSSEIDLKLKVSLDRETRARYDFTITAYDGGSPPLSSILAVTIEVTDVNDNEPVFTNSAYNVTLDGKIPLGTVIVRVQATDADEGNNAMVTYDFSSVQKSQLETTFHIDPTNGNISLIGPLKSGITDFIVEAQDSGTPRLKTQTVVRVNVINTGNTPPRVTITTVGANSDQNVVSVLEPGGRGLFVAFVAVEDDKIDNVVCDISNEVFKMEPVPNKGYKIVLQGTVDRETRDSYNLTVVCNDRGDPPLQASANFTVKIEDANDNAPEFTQKRYSRTIKEGKKNGEFVLQVLAIDKDIGNSAVIVYSIDSDYKQYFDIDSKSGIVKAVGDLDRESTPVMRFNVYGTDKGIPPLESSSEIVIILEDINDNAPQFDEKVFRFQTPEEVGGTRIIASLRATDPDEGVNSQLEYFFTGSLDGADGAFTVLQNGSIMCSVKLDREERVNYSFSVMVRDKGNPPLMSTANVVIEVTDINDNTPIILFPKTQNHTVLISNIPESGVILSRIIAYDDDAGENGTLRFSVTSGNEDRAFQISETSGEFKIADASRLKNMKHYDVGLTVSDRGSPPRSNTTFLKIDVQYDNYTKELVKNEQQKQEDYIIIVAVVAAVTVIFSTLIIVAICVVFQKDRSGRRKPSPKGSFHNLHAPETLSDEEKVPASSLEIVSPQGQHQHYTMNNLSSPPSGNTRSQEENGSFFQVKPSHPESFQNPRGKAVSFSLGEADAKSASRHEAPLFSTFGAPRPGDGDLYHQRSSTKRQVSGVKYSPVNTHMHVGTIHPSMPVCVGFITA